MQITKEQQIQLEKNASALGLLTGAGKWAMKPFTTALAATSAVARPALKATGAILGGAGKGASAAFDRVGLPLITGGAKLMGKGVVATGAPIAGAVGELGRGIGKSVISPAVKGYSNMLKKSPIGTTLGTGFFGMGAKDILERSSQRNFNNNGYQQIKKRFSKVGSEMEKEAGVVDIAKKVTGYGGVFPSMIGLAALGAIPAIAAPSISAFGDSLKRKIFPLDSRINAEEEIAKKQLGIATTHQMDQLIGQHTAMGKSYTDLPILESNLQHYVENDPLISQYVQEDPNKVEQLRETLQTIYKFAPDIATNRQAAHSILRESAMSPDGGLNYNTVKLISDAQKSISGSR